MQNLSKELNVTTSLATSLYRLPSDQKNVTQSAFVPLNTA